MVEYEKVKKGDYENLKLNLNDLEYNVPFEMTIEKKITSGEGQYGKWYLYSCRDNEGTEFVTFVGDSSKAAEYGKKLYEMFDVNIGNKVTIVKKEGKTKTGKPFKYWEVGTGQADQSTSDTIKLEDKKEIKLRNTTTGESEATILNAIKAGGKWNDEVVFIGTLVKYGCDEDRAKELWKNRNSVQL